MRKRGRRAASGGPALALSGPEKIWRTFVVAGYLRDSAG